MKKRATPVTFPPRWSKLVAEIGSVAKLAEELGVTRNAVYTWIRGEKMPRKPTRAHVDAFAAARKLPKPFGGE